MRRALALLLATVGIGYLLDQSCIGCFVRGQHDPRRARTPLGGFRCGRCEKAGASLDDFDEEGFVSPLRKVFSRDSAGGHSESTRTAEWGS